MRTRPTTIDELVQRALALEGKTITELAASAAFSIGDDAVRTKGKVGELLELVLGASGGPGTALDFPDLEVEMKSVPVDAEDKPLESTFVCAFALMDADRAEFSTSWVRKKLSRVLWVPVRIDESRRTIQKARLWSPTAEQERALHDDFDEIVGRIAIGDIEDLSAHVGRYMQLRPKAASGSVRTPAPSRDGDAITTVPRGFYLRARFVGAILRDASAMP